MKNLLPLIIFLFPFFTNAQDAKKVLIIGMDGCRSDALEVANTPNIDNLIANGLFSPDAWNDDITISGPGWSAILCGVWSDKHLVTNNDFAGNDYESFPHLFKYVNDHDMAWHTVSICHWGPINDEIVQDYSDFKLNVSSDLEVATQAMDYITVNDPDIVFLHFDEIDGVGHGSGFNPTNPEYLQSIESVDTHIGTVMNAVTSRPNYSEEDWLVIVTTDHGGIGTSHGGSSMEEENVFFIASGKNVETIVIERDSSFIVDDVMNCLGDSVELHFDGDNDFVEIPADPIFNFGADQDFTIECRVRTSVSGDVAIVTNKDWNSGVNKGFVFSFKFPAGPEWKVNIGDGTNRVDIDTGGEIADNEWYTLSVSFDRDGWMKMYQDGAIIDSALITSIGDIDTGEGLFFGTDFNQEFDFSGTIAEVRVWNTVVEGSVIDLWHCGSVENSHPNYSDLIGYWKLNENGGTAVMDFSNNNNEGTVNNALWSIPDTIVVYDYSNTPRLTDVIPTAFEHLCIPVDDAWGLEGVSRIEECVTTNLEDDIFSEKEIQLFPNPANDFIQLNLEKLDLKFPKTIEIFSVSGKKVFEQKINKKEILIDVSKLTPGTYIFKIEIENNKRLTQKLIKS